MGLILIFISTRFIKYIQLAVEGSISSSAVFSLMGLQIPAVAGFLIPLSFFIAILLTFGRLYSENEMAVIQSSGVSEVQLTRYVMPVAVVLAIFSAGLSFWVTPWSSQYTQLLMNEEKAEAKLGAFSPGRFHENSGKTGVVFVESKEDDGYIKGVFSVSGVKEDDNTLQIQIAQKGYLHRDSEKQQSKIIESSNDSQTNKEIKGDFLVLSEGTNYTFDKSSQEWQKTQYEEYFMRIDPVSLPTLELKTKSMTTGQLFQELSPATWAELHWRLSAPLSIPILCLLAIPLARTAPRKGKFARLFPAIMLYLVYAVLMMNGRRLIEIEKIPVELGYWWIHGAFIAIAYFLLTPKRIKASRRKASV